MKLHKAGPYREYATAHERALRLELDGAKSIKIYKCGQKWWINYVIEDDD